MESATKKKFLISKQKLIKRISKVVRTANTCQFLILLFSPFTGPKKEIDFSGITISKSVQNYHEMSWNR